MGFNDAFGTVYEGSFNFDDNRKVWNLILDRYLLPQPCIPHDHRTLVDP